MWSDIIPQDVQALGAELAKRAACEREAGRTIYPPQEQIFRALELTTPEKVKVCLVGQDPYHEAGQANGLCFSVNRGVLFPPSLKNVFKELVSDIGCPYPKSGDLTHWAEQGVLMLNTVLTVQDGTANSHRNWGVAEFHAGGIRGVCEAAAADCVHHMGRTGKSLSCRNSNFTTA